MSKLRSLTIRGCEYCTDPTGHEVFHVDSPHTLMQAIGYLKHTANPWERIYLRGQAKLYDGFSPTLYRGISNPVTQGNRHRTLNDVLDEFCHNFSLFYKMDEYVREPLLQHYGIQTTWMDIVDNAWVALWFAVHRALVSGKENEYMHFDARDPLNDGEFCYVILVKVGDSRKERVRKGMMKNKDTETIDLRIAAPSIFLRPHVQHGLLFRSRAKVSGREVDYSSAIAGIIRFSLRDAINWLGTGSLHNTRGIFPPAYYDNGYQILLSFRQKERSLGVITHIGV